MHLTPKKWTFKLTLCGHHKEKQKLDRGTGKARVTKAKGEQKEEQSWRRRRHRAERT